MFHDCEELEVARDVLRAHPSDLVWAAAPDLALILAGRSSGEGQRLVVGRAWLSVLLGGGGYLRDASRLAVALTENQRVTLGGIAKWTSAGWPRGRVQRAAPVASVRRRFAQAGVDASAVAGSAASSGLRVDIAGIYQRLLAAAKATVRAEHLLDDGDLVVVASQHDLSARALLRVAQRRASPSVYIPHAPTADNAWYRDLPVTHAGLRGEADRALYRGWGAQAQGIHVVGNPSIRVPLTIPDRRPSSRPIFALSPWPPEVLEELIAAVAPVCTELDVALHPRSDRAAVESHLPAGWRLLTGRTYDALLRGPVAMLQHSSGVAWEGLRLGVPTAQIVLGAEPANYPFIEEQVFPVRCREDLQSFLRSAETEEYASRLQRAALARRWGDAEGAEAVGRIRELLDIAQGATANGMLLDGWGPKSTDWRPKAAR